MTFSVPIDVTSITQTSTSITLTGINCSNFAPDVSSVVWDVVNSNKDSASYCVYSAYTESANILCDKQAEGFGSFASSIYIVIVIMGVVCVLVFIISLVAIIRQQDLGGMNPQTPIYFMIGAIIGLFILIVLFFVAMFSTNAVCSII